ncbi:RING-H2 finger protein ATL5-like [Solanum stenotomum]|uniref:RING-H2 finger protein ATL5-like n=1 Tax=Solanum stenotomum TaxID=172797 RepID=UPI0020D09651|nr:RING-H2 finger protein ATL5-like [Solanum stenotomum]
MLLDLISDSNKLQSGNRRHQVYCINALQQKLKSTLNGVWGLQGEHSWSNGEVVSVWPETNLGFFEHGCTKQFTFTPRNYQLVEQDVQDNLNDQSPPNSPDDSQAATELIDDQEEDAIFFGYFKTRIHRVVEGINNQTETKEICAICQPEFEHEESIGILGCGHEYHIGSIKQWLLRKKDCPMCRASVFP